MRIHVDGIDREMTLQEEEEYLSQIAKYSERSEKQAQVIAKKEAAAASARAKLAALGLTEAEIAALVG